MSEARVSEARAELAEARVEPIIRVRGLTKVKAIALWHALAHNLLRAASLRAVAES